MSGRPTEKVPSPRLVRRYVRALGRGDRELGTKVAADPLHLHRFERSEYSQNGEDGIVAEIFARIGVKDRSFIEIGASDGTENCTRALVESGWRGVWVEGDPEKVVTARSLIGDRPVAVVEAFVDRESIQSLLDDAGASATPDVVVIDIDGNDYWVWEELSSRRRARVVVIEYNGAMGPRRRWVMPYNSSHRWDETYWHGASLAALEALGSRLGYTLVGCDSQGVNAFFVQSTEAAPFVRRTVRAHYVEPRYGLPFGHPRVPPVPFDTPVVPQAEVALVRLELAPVRPTPLRPGGRVYGYARVENGTSVAIGCPGSMPVQLASWWLDERGERLPGEPERSIQPWKAEPNATAHLVGRATAPTIPGTYMLVFGLVQESVRWFDGPAGTQVWGTWTVR